MTRKKADINEYCTAHDAAEILSEKHQRRVRPDYVSKIAKSTRHHIRTAWFGNRLMYHRADIAACIIGEKKIARSA